MFVLVNRCIRSSNCSLSFGAQLLSHRIMASHSSIFNPSLKVPIVPTSTHFSLQTLNASMVSSRFAADREALIRKTFHRTLILVSRASAAVTNQVPTITLFSPSSRSASKSKQVRSTTESSTPPIIAGLAIACCNLSCFAAIAATTSRSPLVSSMTICLSSWV